MEDLKYPIGKHTFNESYTSSEIIQFIEDIESFPKKLKEEAMPLTETELSWRYRPDGWTIRQVIHHCADSHLNSVPRFKLALTENNPTIKPYLEGKWAELYDNASPVNLSIDLLMALHAKWAFLLRKLTPEDLCKTYIHPEHNKTFSLAQTIALYAWHSKHHLAHIGQAKDKKFQ